MKIMNIKIKRDVYGRYKKSNYTFYKWTSILSLSMIAGLFISTEIYYKNLESNYAKCQKEWANNISVSCDTDKYFIYVSEVPKNEITSVLPIKHDTKYKVSNFTVQKAELEQVINVFGRDEKMLAIIFAESGFDSSKTSYNCYYAKSDTGTYVKHLDVKLDYNNVSKVKRVADVSWFCKSKDVAHSWSTDKGLLMINSVHDFKSGDLNHNLQIAKKLLTRSGYNTWSAYKLGTHAQYLDEARLLLTKI